VRTEADPVKRAFAIARLPIAGERFSRWRQAGKVSYRRSPAIPAAADYELTRYQAAPPGIKVRGDRANGVVPCQAGFWAPRR